MAKTSAGELTPALTLRGKTVLKAFEYQDVRLLPGMLLTQVGQARQLYSSISNDDILKGFRHEAGRLAPGDGMKGGARRPGGLLWAKFTRGLGRRGGQREGGA